jgi:hypothetical protein
VVDVALDAVVAVVVDVHDERVDPAQHVDQFPRRAERAVVVADERGADGQRVQEGVLEVAGQRPRPEQRGLQACLAAGEPEAVLQLDGHLQRTAERAVEHQAEGSSAAGHGRDSTDSSRPDTGR